MRRRSLTNSRPAEDLEFRETYMQHEYEDELLPYFPIAGINEVMVPGYEYTLRMHNGLYPLECHHAFGGRLGRWVSNRGLVACCEDERDIEFYGSFGCRWYGPIPEPTQEGDAT